MLAFKNTGLGQVTIVGVNPSGSSATLTGTVTALPAVASLDLYYTSATTNLARAGSVTGTWSSATLDVDQAWQVTDGLTLQTITARDQTPIGSANSRFMRLNVTRP